MSLEPAPLSKTAKYKKITKPLLERKRRARINRCLDELKDLMVGALEIDDDNLSKLEKADILELTVNHLTKLHSPKDPILEAKKFQAGFGQCAAEACRFIMSVPDLDAKVSQNLVSHLSRLVTAQPLTIQVPERPPFSPPHSPLFVISDRNHYYSDYDRSSSDAEDCYSPKAAKQWCGTPKPTKANKPMTGLLTTVDKLHPTQNCVKTDHANASRNGYLNRVPTEAKDSILQKIRQHIMDKRGNDHNHVNSAYKESRHYYREEMYSDDSNHQYAPASEEITICDTLDLRTNKSPVKLQSKAEKEIEVINVTHQPIIGKTVAPTPPLSVPELSVNYSNLPPKKKRKLLEYEECKRREQARLRESENLDRQNPLNVLGTSDAESKWRPW